MEEIRKREDIILFIDEIHEIVGAGSAGDGNMDAGNIDFCLKSETHCSPFHIAICPKIWFLIAGNTIISIYHNFINKGIFNIVG